MSYLKLTIPERDLEFKFNQMAILEIGERAAKNKFKQGTPRASLYSLTSIFFAGLRGFAYAKDIEEDFTWEQCGEWVQLLTLDHQQSILDAFISSEKYKQTQEYLKQQAEQTDSTKKKSVLSDTESSA